MTKEYSYSFNFADNQQRASSRKGLPRLILSGVQFNFSKMGVIQPKIKISQPGDSYEQEADRVAKQVMAKSFSNSTVSVNNVEEEGINRKCSTCEMKKKEQEEEPDKLRISRKPSITSNLETNDEVMSEIDSVRSVGGSLLDANTKEFMESRFGYDFGNVRIHTDADAASSAKLVNALAYTIGNEVVFGEGQYRPNTVEGRRLLAHELTHVVQQSRTNTRLVQRQGNPSTETSQQAPVVETREKRLRRQAATLVDALSTTVADADREGFFSIRILIEHTGEELIPTFEKIDRRERSGGNHASAATIADKHLRHHLEWILMGGRANYEIVFSRSDERGPIESNRFRRIEHIDRSQVTDDLDLPDRRRIYGEIFQKTEQELKDVGVMLAGFTLEQLVLWITGGIFLRALGLLGSVAARSFPYLRRAIGLGRNGNIARAVNSLGEAEAAEFASLMNQLRTGRLNAVQQKRLSELMIRVEGALIRDLPSIRVLSRIKESQSLVREAESLSDAAQREVDDLLQRYLAGNTNPGIGTKHLERGIFYLRGREGGRIFLRETNEGFIEVLGKADKHNESTVIDAILRNFS